MFSIQDGAPSPSTLAIFQRAAAAAALKFSLSQNFRIYFDILEQRRPSRTWEELRISSFTARVNSIRKIKLGSRGLTNLHGSRPAGLIATARRAAAADGWHRDVTEAANSSGSHRGRAPTPSHLSRRNMMIISPRLLLKFESYRAKLPGKEMEINLGGRRAALSDENGGASLLYGDGARQTSSARRNKGPPADGPADETGDATGDQRAARAGSSESMMVVGRRPSTAFVTG